LLAPVLPLNVWVYAGQLQNLAAAGRKFALQGGTHPNLAVVKAQIDFIQSKVPDAEVVVHRYSGEAGAIGAALCARDRLANGTPARFRGYDVIEQLQHVSTTSEATVCHWCAVNCQRTFIDVRVDGGRGREWSKVPLAVGWERVISGNTCPKGLLEDINEMKVVNEGLEEVRRAHPDTAEMVRHQAFKPPRWRRHGCPGWRLRAPGRCSRLSSRRRRWLRSAHSAPTPRASCSVATVATRQRCLPQRSPVS